MLVRHLAAGYRWAAEKELPARAARRPRGAGAALTVRGSVPELLLFVHGRPNSVSVSGDRSLIELWRGHVAFA